MDSLFTLNKERHHQFCVENLVISTVLWMQKYVFFSQCIIGEFKCTVFPIQMYKKV